MDILDNKVPSWIERSAFCFRTPRQQREPSHQFTTAAYSGFYGISAKYVDKSIDMLRAKRLIHFSEILSLYLNLVCK